MWDNSKLQHSSKRTLLLSLSVIFGTLISRADDWEDYIQWIDGDVPSGSGCINYGMGAEGLANATAWVGDMWQMTVGVLYAIAAIVALYSATQIYIKMNLGEEGIKKDIIRVTGACIFLLSALIVVPGFFGYEIDQAAVWPSVNNRTPGVGGENQPSVGGNKTRPGSQGDNYINDRDFDYLAGRGHTIYGYDSCGKIKQFVMNGPDTIWSTRTGDPNTLQWPSYQDLEKYNLLSEQGYSECLGTFRGEPYHYILYGRDTVWGPPVKIYNEGDIKPDNIKPGRPIPGGTPLL